MSHTQEHSHPTGSRLKIAWGLTVLLCVAEFIGGFISNSLSLLSDAGHMLGDVAALSLTLFSMFWARREANLRKTFGYRRAEVLATFINGAVLVFVGFRILSESVHRFLSPQAVELHVMMPIAAAGLVVNIIAAYLLHDFGDHMVSRSAFYHVVSDALSSLAVLFSGLILWKTGWRAIDPTVGVLITILILRSAYILLKEAYDVLMEGSPKGIHLADVRSAILQVPPVAEVHDLHVWTIGSGFYAASAHIVIPNMDIRASDQIVSNISQKLRDQFSINHTTVQVAAPPAPAQIQKL